MNERVIRRHLLRTDGSISLVELPIGSVLLYAGALAGVQLWLYTLQDERVEQGLGEKCKTETRTFLAVKTNEQICLGDGCKVEFLSSACVNEMEYHTFEITY